LWCDLGRSTHFMHDEVMFVLEDFLIENDLAVLDVRSNKKDYLFIKSKYGIHEVRLCSMRLNGVPTIQTAVDKREYFENRAREIHGDKYNYDKVDYKTSKINVTINCPMHGDFDQKPSVHLKGSGCRKCGDVIISTSRKNGICGWGLRDWIELSKNSSEFSGYKVYIIRCHSDNESFIKVGRTFKDLKNRFCGKVDMPYKYDVITEISDNPFRVFKLELKLKKMCKEFSYCPTQKFSGMYECFTPDCLELLKDYIN